MENKSANKHPGFWPNESSGILQPVVKRYLEGVDLSYTEIVIFRAYLRQWIDSDAWKGDVVGQLRASVGSIKTMADINAWIKLAVGNGIDPL